MFPGKSKPNMEKVKTWKTLYYNIYLPGNDGPVELSMKNTESILKKTVKQTFYLATFFIY